MKSTTLRTALSIVTPLALMFAVACDEDTSGPGEEQTFVVEVSGEQFKVRTSDPDVVAILELRKASGQVGPVSGTLVQGDGGFNAPWNWHLDPETVHAPDLTVEVCDGRPSMVEADLDYWLGTVKAFCPWGSKIVQ